MLKKKRIRKAKPRKKITELQIDQINVLAEKGVSDIDIAARLDLGYNTVQRISTLYWREKMEGKNEV